ncbi:hypothetical protein EJ03DRAFT_330090 [Teratosphaeria nubilosa]|uniref:Secreted protein n=1 Tax=Teratosphaeria nubilosa TaxID=161662 RepID=A0A6G1L1B6_9PEZI|nr:hypothetical protein EJ03DRAFT_330090 [Teratosphaeria nubilosa]
MENRAARLTCAAVLSFSSCAATILQPSAAHDSSQTRPSHRIAQLINRQFAYRGRLPKLQSFSKVMFGVCHHGAACTARGAEGCPSLQVIYVYLGIVRKARAQSNRQKDRRRTEFLYLPRPTASGHVSHLFAPSRY